MNKQERHALINKIIMSGFRGMKMDSMVYNDSYNALDKLTDAELLNQNPDLN